MRYSIMLVSESLQFYQWFHVFLSYNFCHLECRKMLSLSDASTPSRRTHISIFVVVTLLIILIAMIFVCSFPFVFVIPLSTTCGTCFRFTGILKVRVASTLNKILILFRYVCPGTSSYGAYLSSSRLSPTHCVKTLRQQPALIAIKLHR